MSIDVSPAEYSGWVIAFGESLTATSQTNLEQLRVLDASLKSLKSVCTMGEALINSLGNVADSIAVGKPDFIVDPDGTAALKYEHAGVLIADIVASLHKRRERTEVGHANADDFNESLLSAFNETIEVYARLYALVEDLRCAIREHDADLSPVVGSFADAEELIASLK